MPEVTPFSTGDGGKPPPNVDTEGAHEPIPPNSDAVSTASGGKPVETGVDTPNTPDTPDTADLVRNALADARQMGRGRRGDPDQARRTRRANLAGRARSAGNRGGYSSPGPDPARDPQRLGSVFAEYAEEVGWERQLAEARVFAEWPALVGPDVAAHCTPQVLNAGELRISAESTAWATQLRLLNAALLARLVAELGPDVVTKLMITGPTGPSWKHGGRSVRGARGPRDTYG